MNGSKLPMGGIETLCIFVNNNIQRVIMILQNKTLYVSNNHLSNFLTLTSNPIAS